MKFQSIYGTGAALKTFSDEEAGSLARLAGVSPLTDVFPMIKPNRKPRQRQPGKPHARPADKA